MPGSQRKFDIVGTGYVPCNKFRCKNARLVLFRPGYGVVSIAFGGAAEGYDSSVVVQEYARDKIADIGADMANGESWRGICLWADRTTTIPFNESDFVSGDIRDVAWQSLKKIGWPTDRKRYFLVGKSGEFHDRPFPSDCPQRESRTGEGLSPEGIMMLNMLKPKRDIHGERVNSVEAKVS